jgi:hypothetical protein
MRNPERAAESETQDPYLIESDYDGLVCEWRLVSLPTDDLPPFKARSCVTNVPHRIKKHSPSGFAWGYRGSGPADLALNTLLHFGASRSLALGWYQLFKDRYIALVPDEGGRIPGETIRRFIQEAREATERVTHDNS